MIKVICREESYRMNVYHLVRAFLPGEIVTSCLEPGLGPMVRIIVCDNDGADGETGNAHDIIGGADIAEAAQEAVLAEVREAPDKLSLEREVYRQLKSISGRDLPWGILTGVRPVKLAMNYIRSHAEAASDPMTDEQDFKRLIMAERLVCPEKAALAWRIACKENRIILDNIGVNGNPDTFSLYVGIPICPSICSYCSFSSGLLSVWESRMDDYVDALRKEIAETASMTAGMQLTSVYIGGGTPTVLTAGQLERLISCIRESFGMEGNTLEFTLEAGRADTITADKLRAAARLGVTRLSINPQTMQQKTLDLVGRRHTVREVADAFALARSMGFDNINMDLIAGLPGEDADDMANTLEQIGKLGPESLTVHSLAVKRAARMNREKSRTDMEKNAGGRADPAVSPAEEMISQASAFAAENGLEPYYLYRQKSIAGNLENVGYALPGRECIYNIMIMEEVQSIIGCGAGASSKILLDRMIPDPGRGGGAMTNILHHTNAKDIADYISRNDEMVTQKRNLIRVRIK